MRILIYGMTKNRAGIESFIFNYVSRFKLLELDFIVYDDNIAFEEKILNLGYNIIKVVSRKESPKLHKKQMKNVFTAKKYDAVWMNVVSLSYILPLQLAKNYNVPFRIIHAHSAQNMGGPASKILHFVNNKRISNVATEFWTCSTEAADWMFSNIHKSRVKLVNNSVNLEDFKFSIEHRDTIRKKFKINDKFVIGHVGRLSPEKNHLKLIDLFKAGLIDKPDSHLLIIGEGEERERIRKYIGTNGLDNNITMVGSVNNIHQFLSAFDVFVLPSKIEGLSVVLVEAQANGLKCFTSDHVVSKAVKITELLEFIDLQKDDKYWARKVFSVGNYQRLDYSDIITKEGFNITIEAQNLEKYFLNLTRTSN